MNKCETPEDRIKEILDELSKAQLTIQKCCSELNEIASGLSGDIVPIDSSKEVSEENTTASQLEAQTASCPYAKIRDLYHSICVSFPKIRNIDGSRRKAVHARWEACNHRIEDFEELFKIAEASSFLKGNNSSKWSANFDWLMKPNNFAKVLEHLYDDKAQKGKSDHESSFSLDAWDDFTLFGE